MSIHQHPGRRNILSAVCMGISLALLCSPGSGQGRRRPAGAPATAPAIPEPLVQDRIPASIVDDPATRGMGALPAGNCQGGGPRTIMLGRPDEFAPSGIEPLFLSPTARAVWGTRLVPFDYDGGGDRVFASSINLGQCKICGRRMISVQMKVRRRAGSAVEDKAFVHFSNGAPNAAGLSPAAAVSDIWRSEPDSRTVKLLTLQVPVAQANQYIFQSDTAFLDILVQEHTAVDYLTVSW